MKILMPIPTYGFDPTETAIPWKMLSENQFEVVFATPEGVVASCDKTMLTGKKLGPFRKMLQARYDAIAAYAEMVRSDSFLNPVRYDQIMENDYDALLLPGGHDKGVKEYLESKVLQEQVVNFFRNDKPVAAICHGVVVAARSVYPQTKRSVLYNYRTTSLLASQELMAYRITRIWLKDYYLTYPGTTVEKEVRSALKEKKSFINGPFPLRRDDFTHLQRGFTVRDRNYLSARWPGDAYNFVLEFINMLEENKS